jgi:hypothetical protein
MSKNTELIKNHLHDRLDAYDCVVIAEDMSMYLAGSVCLIQELTDGLKPLYIARTVNQFRVLRKKLSKAKLKVFYVMDNYFLTFDGESEGKDLIYEYELENDCIMLCSGSELKKMPYPVFDKIEFF